jgi:membrane-bound lytic murein transglycosylase D
VTSSSLLSLTLDAIYANSADGYSVAPDATVEVQPAETLGHYANWLEVATSRLRRLNRLLAGKSLVLGRRVVLDFSKVTPREFERRRVQYHRDQQDAFFVSSQVTGTREHRLRRGDSLWELAQQEYGVPVWLLIRYNPGLNFDALAPGTAITIPVVEKRAT